MSTYHTGHVVSTAEEEVALDLLMERQYNRQCMLMMSAMQAANGNGRIPESWIRSIVDNEELASLMTQNMNLERLAKRRWG